MDMKKLKYDSISSKSGLPKPDLIVVGSGISGIMSAWQAAHAGYSVELFSKSPDPRIETSLEVEKQSSTFDSKNDQRYITIFEGHPYLELEGYVNKVYPGIANDFQSEVLEGGILVSSINELSKGSCQWLEERSRLNAKLLNKSPKDIKQIAGLFDSYARENRAAMERWFEIIIDLVRNCPQVLDNLSLHSEGIVRLYDNSEVFNQSKISHTTENVFIKEYTPQELIKHYPAYLEGVQRGFVAGGAIEVYGLAFAVGTFCRLILDKLEQIGVHLHFKTEVQKVLLNGKKQVDGIILFGEQKPCVANHYVFHTGAFAGPELFGSIPKAYNKLAAVEGYWITIKNAKTLVAGMGNKPNKVHGKKSLEEILGMIDANSAKIYRRRFKELGVNEKRLCDIAPIVDFNNMPIIKNGETLLGVGSGYVFKGVAERGKDGKVIFEDNPSSGLFVLTVMELWLEALHGKELLSTGSIVIHPIGCKRSFTPTDQELDVNLQTESGGLCMIHDGGNTGSTTKSPFIAKYILEKMKIASTYSMDAKNAGVFSEIRKGLSKSAYQVPTHRWEELSRILNRIRCIHENNT